MKSFQVIPGPRALPLVGSLLDYKLFKTYDFKRLYETGLAKYKAFGPVVKERIGSNPPILWIFDPADMKTLYNIKDEFPGRTSHLALEKYRKDKPLLYSSGGLLPTNGEEWRRLRMSAQKPMLDGNLFAKEFVHVIDKASLDFVESLKSKSVWEDILEELKKHFLEITTQVVLGTSCKPLENDPEALQLIRSAMDTNSSIHKTDMDFRWKLYETKEYATIRKSQEFIENMASKCISEKKWQSNPSIFNAYTQDTTKLSDRDRFTLVADFLLAGIDTSAYTMAFMLYELSKNALLQNELLLETNRMSNIDAHIMKNFKRKFPLVDGIIQENFRMHPISVGVGRTVREKCQFSGYEIPAGSYVVTQNQVSSRLKAFCPYKPNEFCPDRFTQPHNHQALHPGLIRPFGFGARRCIGKKMAEYSLRILLIRLSQAFQMEYVGKHPVEMNCVSNLINEPEYPISLKLTKRK